MAQRNKGGVAAIQRHYDKIVAVLVLVGLLVSLVYLSQSAQRRVRDLVAFDSELAALVPQFPKAEPIEETPFMRAQQLLSEPFQMTDATSLPFLVAQDRVWCVECRQPIRLDADVCPFCRAEQPDGEIDELWDSSGDGIPDVVKLRYGLDPFSTEDAHQDMDGDGFTNLEEYLAGTDMSDPACHPPRIPYLRVHKVVDEPFTLLLRGIMRGPNGRIRYQINDTRTQQTHYVAEGQPIGDSGFTVKSGTTRKVVRQVPGHREPREVEIHVVTVARNGSEIVLEQDAARVTSDYTITFRNTRDRTPVDYVASSGEDFVFDGEEYEVITIDRDRETVVLRRQADREEFVIPRG